MRTWKLTAGSPLHLGLAADAGLISSPQAVDYTNDVSWEINLGGGEPAALAVQTTLGLRARWLQFFPLFTRLGKTRIDPSAFHNPPAMVRFSTSYAAIAFAPFEGLEAQIEFRAAASRLLIGRIQVANKTILPQNLRLEWAGLLSPLGTGESMAALPLGLGHALHGQSSRIAVVCCLTGGAQPGKSAYPALALQSELYPGAELHTTWAVGIADTIEDAFQTARGGLERSWDAELARIEIGSTAETLEICCGNPDWDATLALAQKAARGLVMPATSQLPRSSFILVRRPDFGASARNDGSDHPDPWRGQTSFDAHYLAGLLLPGSPLLVRGWVENFLHTQAEQGYVDFRPGLGGQQGRLLAQPFMASLALQGAPLEEDSDWLAVMYPGLLHFFRTWLDEDHDRDGDGLPEWSHPLQLAIDDHPLFDRWSSEAQGIDAGAVESPALGALLYYECLCLIEIARRIGREEDLAWLSAQAARLFAGVEETWDRQAACYGYRDMNTHLSLSGRTLLEFKGSGAFNVRRKLRAPQRLVLQVNGGGEGTRAVNVVLHGVADGGEEAEEIFQPRDFSWSQGRGRVTTRACYLQVEQLEINGLTEEDSGALRSIDLDQLDISLLLPLWAGIPTARRAAALVQQQVMGGWLESCGLALCPPGQRPDPTEPGRHPLSGMALPWNGMVIEGLLRYGYRTEAAELFSRLMSAVTQNLKLEHSFRQFYQADGGVGMGERDHLWGLPSPNLFLRIVGVEILAPGELIVRDFNPFPWPVTVKYHRMSVIREGDQTTLYLPGRPPQNLSGREARRISHSGSKPL
jgi:hypothetical protein